MNKNKILTLITACICCFLLLSGCSNRTASKVTDTGTGLTASANDNTDISRIDSQSRKKISIVCTTFPQYDWVREIIGQNEGQFDVTLLLDSGIDLHSYQPTVEDISKISSADIFIYVGGESDDWAEAVLKEATNRNIQTINMLEALGDAVKTEEMVEGMQESGHHHHEESEHNHEEEHDEHAHETEYDEHVWLSLKNAKLLVQVISDQIAHADAEHAESYTTNTMHYLQELEELDKQYAQMVTSAKYDTLLFGDRFPFRYLVDDYHLNYYAAFSGCSAETEASFETITFLSQKADELNLHSILVLENTNTEIAETIKQNTAQKNQTILSLNSIQSVDKTDIENSFTYLKAMQENLEVLTKALN